MFDHVSLRFGDVAAVDNVSLEIADGEFFSLLGPSGSGKTTSLRLIAGFEQPDAGEILLHGVPASGLPPYQRDVNTVFQDYALFPHMSVRDNVAYSLMIRKVPRAERRRRAEEMLDRVRLGGMADRRPAALSGGQRQRVSLARALINQPRILLLDEPLGALDLKLREQMQEELKGLQQDLGITFIYVTHDQQEALTMSDRIAVFDHGRLQQVGAPREIYDHPANAFVANFVGVSNLLDAATSHTLFGIDGATAVRPESIRIEAPARDDAVRIETVVESIVFQGQNSRLVLACDGARLSALFDHNADRETASPETGKPLAVWILREDVHRLGEGG